MKRTSGGLPLSFLLLLLIPNIVAAAPQSQAPDSPEAKQARLAWFKQAKYGLFIYWGLYAIPAGEWKGKTRPGLGERIMNHCKIPVREYEQLAKQWNPVVEGYQIVHTYPHDPSAFTQGLVYADGHLYESTGLHGKSSIRLVDLETGRVLQHHELPAQYFGEGLTVWNNRLFQLTWKSRTGFVYDLFSFAIQQTFRYDSEGWGLTHNQNELILSDGSSVLRFLDPQSFRETRRLQVRDDRGQAIDNLNELEYIQGEIYANIWQTDRIARISPKTGKVLRWIDLTGLIDKRELPNSDAVLNGIAYDLRTNRIFVTGKLWPKLFEIKVIGPKTTGR